MHWICPAQWLCLDDVDVGGSLNAMGQPVAWSSKKLSRLVECNLDAGEPLQLAFDVGDSVDGTFRGETIAWENTDFDSSEAALELTFDSSTGERITLSLELAGGNPEDTGDFEIVSAELVASGGDGSVACGGSGTLTAGEDSFVVDVESFSDWATCPGEPVEGELEGNLDAL